MSDYNSDIFYYALWCILAGNLGSPANNFPLSATKGVIATSRIASFKASDLFLFIDITSIASCDRAFNHFFKKMKTITISFYVRSVNVGVRQNVTAE